MKKDYDELKGWLDEARQGLREKIERLEDESRQINSYMRVLDAMDELVSMKEDLEHSVPETSCAHVILP